MKYTVAEQNAGRQKYGYLLLLRDKTGRIIQHDESNAWLWKNHENLARLPVGAFMDKNCVRVYPTGLKPTKY